jgi:hypothetical protein
MPTSGTSPEATVNPTTDAHVTPVVADDEATQEIPSPAAADKAATPAGDAAASDTKQSGTEDSSGRVTIIARTTASGCRYTWFGPFRTHWGHGSGFDYMRASFRLRRCQHGASIRRVGGRYDTKGSHQGCGKHGYMLRAGVSLKASTTETSHRTSMVIPCDEDTQRHREVRVRGMRFDAPPCPQPTCPVVLDVDLREKIVIPHWWDKKKLFEVRIA